MSPRSPYDVHLPRGESHVRFPHALAHGPSGDYVVLPVYAFNPENWSEDGNETYPLMKQHGVIATGTKTECLRGLLLIRKEAKRTSKKVPLNRALELIESVSEKVGQARDWSKCHRCYGEGSVYVARIKIRCPLCGGTGRGMR